MKAERAGAPGWATCGASAGEEKGRVKAGRCGRNRKEEGREGKGCWAASRPAREGEEKEKARPMLG